MADSSTLKNIDLTFRSVSKIISISVQPLERMNLITSVAHYYSLNYISSFLWNPGYERFCRVVTCQAQKGGEIDFDIIPDNNIFDIRSFNILDSLDFIANYKHPALFFIEYTGALLKNGISQSTSSVQIESLLVNLCTTLKYSKIDKKVILVNLDNLVLPLYMRELIPQIDIPLPNYKSINSLINNLVKDLNFNDEQIGRVSAISSGLSTEEIKAGVRYSILTLEESKDKSKHVEKTLLEQKVQRLKNIGLTLIESPIVPDIGGLDNLKNIIDKVKIDFSENARLYKVPLPKGLLLVGPPGTGKTLSASVVAKKLEFPLVIADTGSIVEGGPQFLKELIQRLEAMGAAVAYFDELDKLFTISSGGEDTNSARTRAVLGTLLTWLQEKRSKIYVIGTLNRLKALPPELTRKGRFDELLYVDFPNAQERRDVLFLHLARFDHRFKAGIDAYSLLEWRQIINNTNKCTSSELAAIVEAAASHLSRPLLIEGKWAPIEISYTNLLDERAQITPLFFRDTDRIIALENEARLYCKPASSPDNSIYKPEDVSLWGEKR